jgi:ABC-type hemin transport system ATPase subunit
VAAHLPWLIGFNWGVFAQGRPENMLTPDTLRAAYGSEMLVFRQHGYTLVAKSPLVYRGLRSDRPD